MINFSESQRFAQWWLWAILIVSSASPVVLILLLSKHDTLDWVMIGTTGTIGIAVLLLFTAFRLETTIDENGVSYRFFPFQLKMQKKTWTEIEKAYVRKYSPISEYGGWGMRYTFGNGKALNIAGDMGLQIVFKGGKRLLLGTQQPDAMKDTLQELVRTRVLDRSVIEPLPATH